jgi:glucuronate isomerase
MDDRKEMLERKILAGISGCPIIDYHSHLSAADIAADRRFENLTEIWIAHDPYKHRAMRIAGVPEALITGTEGTPFDRFKAWAETVPKTAGNPLWLWTRLELKRVFAIDQPLNPQTAAWIWNDANAKLKLPDWSARGLLKRFMVQCVCTSDGLLDDLSAHERLRGDRSLPLVLPSLRGDDIAACEPEWLERLAGATGIGIDSFGTFRNAVSKRLSAFELAGCRLADHALDAFMFEAVGEAEADALFRRKRAHGTLPADGAARLRSAVLGFLGREYGLRGWIMQLHLGAQRRTSTRLRRLAGAAGGYAAPGCACDVASLCALLDDLEQAGRLPQTILYTLNPADNAVLATLTGSYAEDGVEGKIQFGPAWWYNDHPNGIRQHLDALAAHGLLSTFIGMTTDSRSLLSMVRHEVFRRVLSGALADWARQGLVPEDDEELVWLARQIAYGNACKMVLQRGAVVSCSGLFDRFK